MMSFLGLFNRVSFAWKNNYFLTLWIQESLGRFNSFSFFENIDDFFIGHRYANRAKNIKNKPKINEDPKDALLREFQEEIGRWYNTNHVKLLSAVWHIISMSYIAESARGHDEANPVSWLAIRGRKMRLSCQLAKTTTNQTNKQKKVRHFWIVWAMESQKAAENSPNKEKRLKLSTRHHS